MIIYQRGNVWYVDYTFNGKRIRYVVGDKSDAERELEKVRYELKEGIHQPHKRLIFDNLLKEYQKWDKAHKGIATDKYDFGKYKALQKFFGGKRIDRITLTDAEEYQRIRVDGILVVHKKGISNTTVNHEIGLLKRILKKAVDWNYLEINPLRNVKKLKEPPGRVRYVKPDEWPILLSECSPDLRDIVIFARHTGMRRGEIFNLQWTDIDWQNKRVTVRERKNNTTMIIPINDYVFRMLVRLHKTTTSAFVFPGKEGKRRYTLRTAFEAACRRAGIKNLRFHDLRHTFGTDLVNSGADISIVKQLMGHKSIISTMRYVHPTEERMRKVLENRDKIFEGDTNLTQPQDDE